MERNFSIILDDLIAGESHVLAFTVTSKAARACRSAAFRALTATFAVKTEFICDTTYLSDPVSSRMMFALRINNLSTP